MNQIRDFYSTGSFIQRTRKFYLEEQGLASKNVLNVVVDKDNHVWAGTDLGLFVLKKDAFVAVSLGVEDAVNALFCDSSNTIWAGVSNKLFRIKKGKLTDTYNFTGNVSAITESKDSVLWMITDQSLYKFSDEKWTLMKNEVCSDAPFTKVTSLAALKEETVYSGTLGVLSALRGKRFHWRSLLSVNTGIISDNITALKFDKIGHLWVGTDKGIAVYDTKSYWADNRTVDMLTKMQITSIDFDDVGGKYFGTDKGVIYIKNGKRRFFNPRIWVPDFYINDISVSSDGKILAVATKEGLSIIKGEEMTLEKKADYFEGIVKKHHTRRDFVINAILSEYENMDSSRVQISDNDGLWTGSYIISQSFKYGATGDKKTLESARKSMKALIFLSDITGIPGFCARAVRYPGDDGFGNGDMEWHLSADKTCEWKGETSSDEMTGHFCAYAHYFDMCADENDKKELARVVGGIMDHIIENNFKMCDIDGKPTTWADWSPESLNNDDVWSWEKGINSLEILAYLKTTYHITGNEKYQNIYLDLIHNHHYALNVLQYKMPDYHTCHIDDNLATLSNLILLRLEKDEDLRSMYLMGLEHFWQYERIEKNPLFNMVYGIFTGSACDIDSAIYNLKDMNLDLLMYSIDATGRDDIEIDHDPEKFGMPTQLKYPLDYSQSVRHNFDQHVFKLKFNGGYGVEYPNVFLLPYWMGRYYKIIKEADKDLK